jgi:hypothetical protein
MSLQLIAKQMEAKGRKGDSMLVHMTPGEVDGLQKLAEAAGGSLSVNPETGLVEANFLKRMLPTLVGIGVGAATMNPYAGAAAGAAVGGYQARRNDQDVLLGAAMGGLGGYGGAGLGAGLTSAGAGAAQSAAMGAIPQGATTAAHTAAQNAAMQGLSGAAANNAAAEASKTLMAQGFATDQGIQNLAAAEASKNFMAQPVYTQLGQGASALGKEAGRDAFMQNVGGIGGLAKTASMATAPMMAPGKIKTEEMPKEDDEMIVYDYDVGRTGAELNPTATSAERTYFQPTYANRRKVRAGDYFNAAEGGEVADTAPADEGVAGGMSGASKAAFDYLMGNAASSAPAGGIANLAARATPGVGSDNMYAFDPVTGTFLRNPNVPGAETSSSRIGTSLADFGGGGGGYDAPMSQQTIDFFDRETPAQRDARMAEVQNLFSLSPTGALFSALRGDEARAPDFGTLIGTSNYYDSLGIPSTQFADSAYDYGPGVDSWSGNMSDYAGSSMDQGDRGEAAGGLITLADGGLMGLAKGGMKSGGFVVPADVVSMIGEGNTDAGYSRIKSMIPGATAIKGKDGGQADTVKTSIEGKQPARVAHGEMYVPPETVKRMGGAKKLYAMMDRVREQATGSKKQIKPVSLKRAMA